MAEKIIKVKNEFEMKKWFEKNFKKLGYSQIINKDGGIFPDFVMLRDGKKVRVELETISSNFLLHNHNITKVDELVCIEKNIDFFIVIEASRLPYKEILEDDEVKPTFLGNKENIKLNKNDIKIIKELARNARMPIIDISSKTKLSVETVRYSIKKLESSGIIQAYKPQIDVIKIGYMWYMMLIKFNYCSETKQKEFIDFLKRQKQVFYIVKGVGNWGLTIDLHIKNIEEFDEIHSLISSKFEKIIRDERIIQILKEHKCIFLPEINV